MPNQRTYKCFRCGESTTKFGLDPLDEVPSRDCPSCTEHHTLFTYEEMGDIINNFYIEGVDVDLFGAPKEDG